MCTCVRVCACVCVCLTIPVKIDHGNSPDKISSSTSMRRSSG